MGGDISKDLASEELEDHSLNGFSDKQLEIIGSHFSSLCYPDKALSHIKFAKLCNLTPELSKPIFEFINMNGDNWIDLYEFTCALALFLKSSMNDRLEAIFELYDTDQSLVLEKSECILLFKVILMAPTGQCPSNEVIEKKRAEAYNLEKIKLDKSLHMEEFKKIALKDPELRKGLISLGIIVEGDIELDGDIYDEDINAEVNIQNDMGHDAEYQARKAGVDDVDAGVENDGGLFKSEDIKDGDQFIAVKPWKGSVKEPTGYKKNPGDEDAPDASLELEYVYGYRCHDVRNNVNYCLGKYYFIIKINSRWG